MNKTIGSVTDDRIAKNSSTKAEQTNILNSTSASISSLDIRTKEIQNQTTTLRPTSNSTILEKSIHNTSKTVTLSTATNSTSATKTSTTTTNNSNTKDFTSNLENCSKKIKVSGYYSINGFYGQLYSKKSENSVLLQNSKPVWYNTEKKMFLYANNYGNWHFYKKIDDTTASVYAKPSKCPTDQPYLIPTKVWMVWQPYDQINVLPSKYLNSNLTLIKRF